MLKPPTNRNRRCGRTITTWLWLYTACHKALHREGRREVVSAAALLGAAVNDHDDDDDDG